jgi:ribonuclease J
MYSKLAQSVGMSPANILLVDNGYVIELNIDEIYLAGRVPAGNVFVDGLSVGGVGHVVIRDRQLLARDGVLLVVVTVDKAGGQLLAGPDIVTRGFVYAAEAGTLLEDTKDRIKSALQQKNGTTPPDWSYLNKKIRDTVSQYLYEQTKRRPMVLPVVVEI